MHTGLLVVRLRPGACTQEAQSTGLEGFGGSLAAIGCAVGILFHGEHGFKCADTLLRLYGGLAVLVADGQAGGVTGQDTGGAGEVAGGPGVGSVNAGSLDLLALGVEVIPGVQGLVLPVDAGLFQHIGIAEDQRNEAHKGNGEVLAIVTGGCFPGTFIEAVCKGLVPFIDGGQIQQVNGPLEAHGIPGAGAEHIRQTHTGHQAGQQIGIVLGYHGDGVDIVVFFHEFLDPLIH